MYDSIERKGKIFTNVVTKKPVEVLIQTATHIISGKIHVRPDRRLKDELDNDNSFVAVTNAEIKDLQGNLIYKTRFIAINRTQVIWILPIHEINSTQVEEE